MISDQKSKALYCYIAILTHGAVVTDPLVHGLGDPRLGLHQPGAAQHRRQQPRHLCSASAVEWHDYTAAKLSNNK